ncbi:MAG: hypothetical protein JKY73_02540 [Lutibacter sp.]|nr:hypothetical protein [Lutibacter sp.]
MKKEQTKLLFKLKKLMGLRAEKEEVQGLDIQLLGLDAYLYFRANRY